MFKPKIFPLYFISSIKFLLNDLQVFAAAITMQNQQKSIISCAPHPISKQPTQMYMYSISSFRSYVIPYSHDALVEIHLKDFSLQKERDSSCY